MCTAVNKITSRANGYEEDDEDPLANIDMNKGCFEKKNINQKNFIFRKGVKMEDRRMFFNKKIEYKHWL